MFGVSNLYFKVLGFHSLTVNNYVLVGSLYQVIHVDDWFGCILSCHGDLRCISYNYNTSSRLCELNYCSGLHLCDRDDLLIYSTGCVFQKIRDCEVSQQFVPGTSRSFSNFNVKVKNKFSFLVISFKRLMNKKTARNQVIVWYFLQKCTIYRKSFKWITFNTASTCAACNSKYLLFYYWFPFVT